MLWRTAAHLLLLGLPAAGAASLRRPKRAQAAEAADNVVAPTAGAEHENNNIVRLQRRVARLTSALLNQTETTQILGGIIAQHEQHAKKVDQLLETLAGRQSEIEKKANGTAAGNTTEGSSDADDLAALAGPSPLELPMVEPPAAVNITEAANTSPAEVLVFDVDTNDTEKLALEDLFLAPEPLADDGLEKGEPEVAIAPAKEPAGSEKVLVSKVARAMREDIMRARAEHNQSALKERVAVAKKFLAANKKLANKASEDANVTDTNETGNKTHVAEALNKVNVTGETNHTKDGAQTKARVASSNPLRAIVASKEEVEQQVAESLKRWAASSPLRDSRHSDKSDQFQGRGNEHHGRRGANLQKVNKAGTGMLVASEADATNARFTPQEKRARQKLSNRAASGLGETW